MATTMKQNRRGKQRDDIALVKAAIEHDASTYEKIKEKTGLHAYRIKELFTIDKELYALYKMRRKMLVEMAADNLQAIVEDPNHPQHFSASKYVLQHYKSDLDEVLDSKDNELDIEIGGDISGADNISIVFGKKEKSEDGEED